MRTLRFVEYAYANAPTLTVVERVEYPIVYVHELPRRMFECLFLRRFDRNSLTMSHWFLPRFTLKYMKENALSHSVFHNAAQLIIIC